MRFELHRARRGVARRPQFYFRIVAENGETLAHSEGYANREDALSAMAVISHGALVAEVRDET